jgi:hypothetical protein
LCGHQANRRFVCYIPNFSLLHGFPVPLIAEPEDLGVSWHDIDCYPINKPAAKRSAFSGIFGKISEAE